MKKLLTILFCLAIAASAHAGVINELQTGVHAENTVHTIQGTVTASLYSSVCVAEAAGAFNGIWCYVGSSHGLNVGDQVEITGEYLEYYTVTEIDVANTGGTVTVLGSGSVPAPTVMSAAMYMADPEPWESVMVTLEDAFSVTEIDETHHTVITLESMVDGTVIRIDDEYFFSGHPYAVGDCLNNVTGYGYTYQGEYKISAAEEDMPMCGSVATEATSFDELKSLYR